MAIAAPSLRSPLGMVHQRFRRWWQSRLPLSDTVTLTQRNVYILPTRPGFMLAGTLLVLLIASINYQLNLGYLLTFLLAGSAVVGMHVCHATLRGLTLHLIAPDPAFALAPAIFNINLTNARARTRHAIGLSVYGTGHWSWTDVPAQGMATVQVTFESLQRGRHRLPALTAETRFPLGTFRVWTIWRPAAQLLVYPAPELRPPPLPPGEPRAGGSASARVQTSGEFDGVRAYRRGDPLKLVVWKKAAKTLESGSDSLVSRDGQQAQQHELWLDYQLAGQTDVEQRLSRLCAWVLQADRLGLDFGLRLPNLTVPPASGEAHKRRCLESLALY
ncbi:MAG: DUF58 domain-containing protein [Pseudomonadota bacterium]